MCQCHYIPPALMDVPGARELELVAQLDVEHQIPSVEILHYKEQVALKTEVT